jgi:tetratricopeptide (TPR) repeat protein
MFKNFLRRSGTPEQKYIEEARALNQAALELPQPFEELPDEWKEYARSLMKRFEEWEAQHGAFPTRQATLPMLLSKNGRYEEALALTEQAYQQTPNWGSAIAVAAAARRAGDLERAVAMFTKSAEYDPKDDTCWLDIGDIRLEQGRFVEALEAYENALRLDARHPWALPSAFYCRYRLSMEGNWLASLHEVANQEGCTCGLQGCLTEIFGGYSSQNAIERAQYLLSKPI